MQAETLIEPGLGFGAGFDRDVAVADAVHFDGRGELFGRRNHLHVGHVVGHLLRERERSGSEAPSHTE